ncbi:hypothetical protein LB506_011764 [Fusarium annulatum]|nr:hypothetical protein LB506_011764 [Fusarium annulatum]
MSNLSAKPGTFFCDHCDPKVRFESEKELCDHLWLDHIACGHCGQVFETFELKKQHDAEAHNRCAVCYRFFVSSAELKQFPSTVRPIKSSPPSSSPLLSNPPLYIHYRQNQSRSLASNAHPNNYTGEDGNVQGSTYQQGRLSSGIKSPHGKEKLAQSLDLDHLHDLKYLRHIRPDQLLRPSLRIRRLSR